MFDHCQGCGREQELFPTTLDIVPGRGHLGQSTAKYPITPHHIDKKVWTTFQFCTLCLMRHDKCALCGRWDVVPVTIQSDQSQISRSACRACEANDFPWYGGPYRVVARYVHVTG